MTLGPVTMTTDTAVKSLKHTGLLGLYASVIGFNPH